MAQCRLDGCGWPGTQCFVIDDEASVHAEEARVIDCFPQRENLMNHAINLCGIVLKGIDRFRAEPSAVLQRYAAPYGQQTRGHVQWSSLNVQEILVSHLSAQIVNMNGSQEVLINDRSSKNCCNEI